jgi:hypothetical protein
VSGPKCTAKPVTIRAVGPRRPSFSVFRDVPVFAFWKGWALVAIPDKGAAIRAIKARHPHAAVRVDSEADAELLAKYDVRDGKIFVLVEGS